MNEDKFNINVITNGYKMNLRINREDEYVYRQAQKVLNERLSLYLKTFEEIPYKDILNMVAYEIAVEYVKLRELKTSQPQETLRDLDDLLDGINL